MHIPTPTLVTQVGLTNSVLATQPGGTSVLKSVDEILRDPFSATAAPRTAAAAGLYGGGAGTAGLSTTADLLAATRTSGAAAAASVADPLLTAGVNSALLNNDLSDLAHARRLTASAAGHMASAAGSLGLASSANPSVVGGLGGLVNSDPYSRSAAMSSVYR